VLNAVTYWFLFHLIFILFTVARRNVQIMSLMNGSRVNAFFLDLDGTPLERRIADLADSCLPKE